MKKLLRPEKKGEIRILFRGKVFQRELGFLARYRYTAYRVQHHGRPHTLIVLRTDGSVTSTSELIALRWMIATQLFLTPHTRCISHQRIIFDSDASIKKLHKNKGELFPARMTLDISYRETCSIPLEDSRYRPTTTIDDCISLREPKQTTISSVRYDEETERVNSYLICLGNNIKQKNGKNNIITPSDPATMRIMSVAPTKYVNIRCNSRATYDRLPKSSQGWVKGRQPYLTTGARDPKQKNRAPVTCSLIVIDIDDTGGLSIVEAGTASLEALKMHRVCHRYYFVEHTRLSTAQGNYFPRL